jgi:pimeloyl-ACP methyl ester carboxylesterase
MERRFDSEGISIYFRVLGAGPPVVLLHGAFLDGEATFGRVAPVLARSYQLVIPDLRGHGCSDKPTTPAAYGAELYLDVLRLLDHLALSKVALLGYSMGGTVAQKVAVALPGRVSHLVVGGVGWTPPDGFPDGEAFAELLEASGSVRAALDPEGTSYVGDVAKALDRMSLETALAVARSEWPSLGVDGASLRELRIPFHVFVGSNDPVRPDAEALSAMVPGAVFDAIKGFGHTDLLDSPVLPSRLKRYLDSTSS